MADDYERRMEQANKAIEEHLSSLRPKERILVERIECPECIENTVLDETEFDGIVKCYLCRQEYKRIECARCGNPILNSGPPDDNARTLCVDCA